MTNPHIQFWSAEEKRLGKLVVSTNPETMEGLVARKWWLTARANVALLDEMVKAHEWRAWGFYRLRAAHIAAQFGGSFDP